MAEENLFIPDYSKYNLKELNEIYARIDKERFLERVNAIENEIRRQEQPRFFRPTLIYANFWSRAGATVVDIIIALLFYPLTSFLYSLSFENRSVLPIAVESLLMLWLVNVFFIMKYGGTPGKLIIGLRVLNDKHSYLNFKEAFLRVLPYLIVSIANLMQINNAINTMPSGLTSFGMWEASVLVVKYGGIYTILYSILGYFTFIDLGAILFNEKRRALHDYLAGSFVITKKSIDSVLKYNMQMVSDKI